VCGREPRWAPARRGATRHPALGGRYVASRGKGVPPTPTRSSSSSVVAGDGEEDVDDEDGEGLR